MRYVSSAICFALSFLSCSVVPPQAHAQDTSALSLVSYQVISRKPITSTLANLTYSITLQNTGTQSLGPVIGRVSSRSANVRPVPGQDEVTFPSVPPNSRAPGSYIFSVLVDETQPLDIASSLEWTFQATAAPPAANAGANQTVKLGGTVMLNGGASTNPSGIGTLTYTWSFTSRPAGSTATLSAATMVNPTFVVDVAGTYGIQLIVSNGVTRAKASVLISTENSAPVAVAGPNQSVAVGSAVTLNGSSSSDVDGDSLTFHWALIAAPSGSTAALKGADTVSPNFVTDQAGQYIAELVVTDGVFISDPSTVTITTGNTAPVANAGPNQVVVTGSQVQLNGSSSTDVDGDLLTYHWSLINLPEGSSAALSDPTAVNSTFSADLAGTYVAQLIVNDGTADSAAATVTITTNAIQAPTANAGPNQTVGHGTTVTLGGAGTDPQGLPLTFEWALINKPTGSNVVLSSISGGSPTFVADRPGTFVAQLIVKNGFRNSAPSTVTITTINTPPVADAGTNQNVLVGATVILDGSGSWDADHDPLAYSWALISRPIGSNATLSAANSPSPTFNADVPGTYVAQLMVNAGFVSSNPTTVVITSVAVNLTPPTPATVVQASGPSLSLSRNSLNFGVSGSVATSAQTVVVTLVGGDNINWTASSNKANITLSSTSGTGSGTFDVSVTSGSSGIITVTAPGAANSPQQIQVNITSVAPGNPFGSFDTPANNATGIAGAVPVTGWTLDSIEVTSVGLWRDPVPGEPVQANGLVFIGTAGFVADARPDVAATFPTLPWNYRAGWGYMLLTNFLPPNGGGSGGGGNGTYRLHAIAVNKTGQSVELGVKTITVDNAHASKPFGTIDTPEQGGTVSGNAYVNFGWALTQNPSCIPTDGSTITVVIDGVPVGHPAYNQARSDIATLFPGLCNSNGAVGFFIIDTTKYSNGVHTISWNVFDSAGHGEGIGSRYFTVANTTVVAGPPASIVASTGGGQSTVVNTSFAAPLKALVKDAKNNPVKGATVTFTGPGSGAGIATVTAVTDTTGVASASVTANGTAGGPYNVNATVAGVAAPAVFSLTNISAVGPPASVLGAGGNGQNAQVNTTFATPLKALVKDSNNNPVPGITVTFTGPGSGASIVTKTAVTDSSGIATASVVANGNVGGPYTVNGTVAGVAAPAVYILTNTSGPPATVTATGGTGQSAVVNTAFAMPLTAIVKDIGGNPVSGASVVFSGPASGASIATVTVLTNSAGIATASVTANATSGGPYTVTASVTGATSATFTLSNTPVSSGGGIGVTSVTVGQNLEANITVTLPQPAPGGGATVTLTSSDSTKLLLGGLTSLGTGSLTFTIAEGNTTATGIQAQALASSGTATITATAPNFTSGTGTITFSPSGFVLAGPNPIGVQSFSTNQGVSTPLTVSAARLDAMSNFVQLQPLRGGTSVAVTVNSSNTSVGTISSSPLTFNGGDQNAATTFNAVSTGSVTLTAVVPAGFNLPAAGANTQTVAVNPVGLVPPAVTVGQGLEATTFVTLNGAAPGGGVSVTISSNDPSKLLFSNTPTGIGMATINVMVPGGLSRTADFYAYGLASTGTPTYNATAAGFGSATGTVTLAPSGFVIQGPGPLGTPSFLTTTGAPTTAINVLSARLDAATHNVVDTQAVAGGTSVNVNVTSSLTSVGTITTSPVTISGGFILGTTQFQPATAGSTTLSVVTPAGFTASAQYASIVANVITPGIGVPPDGTVFIGQKLQQQLSFSLGQLAPAGGVTVTLTSNDTSKLLLSKTASAAGTSQITINVAAGTNSGSYYVQSLGISGSPTYVATAPGYAMRTGSVTLTPSAPVISPPLGLGTPFFNTTVAAGPSPFTVSMAQLNPDLTVSQIEQVAAGQSFTVTVNNTNAAVGTIAASVTIPGGSDSVNTNFTPKSAGGTTVSVTTTAANDKSIAVTVQ